MYARIFHFLPEMSFSWYSFWGFTSSLMFLSAVPAILHQLLLIWRRKRLFRRNQLDQTPTQSISLNQVFSSFAGVYSFFLFGFVLPVPDPYLTYPRALLGVLLYLVILELYLDRRSKASCYTLMTCSFLMLLPLALWSGEARTALPIRSFSQAIVILATVLMAQGAYAQYKLLKRTRQRGAVSLPMHIVLYLKDFTGVMFGIQIGFWAWSIIIMHLSNLIMRAPIIITYLKLAR